MLLKLDLRFPFPFYLKKIFEFVEENNFVKQYSILGSKINTSVIKFIKTLNYIKQLNTSKRLI